MMLSVSSLLCLAALQEERMLYNSDEHDIVGSTVNFTETLADGSVFKFDGGERLDLEDKGKISCGEMLMMCGDWYNGDYKKPVCLAETLEEREGRFMDMFNKVGTDVTTTDVSFRKYIDTARSGNKLATTVMNPSWIFYTSNNIDHFTKAAALPEPPACGNWEAYTAGHEAALKAARSATTVDEKGTGGSLHRALLMNACAQHFLSDSFAGGHIRTPIQQIFFHGDDSTWSLLKNLDGLVGGQMHINDNSMGLAVQNKRGEKWIAYGDGCLANAEDHQNQQRQITALTLSSREIVEAYKTSPLRGGDGKINTALFDIEAELPDSALAQDAAWQKKQGNPSPMFIAAWDADAKKSIVKRRSDFTNNHAWEFETIHDWGKLGWLSTSNCQVCGDREGKHCTIKWGYKWYILIAAVVATLTTVFCCCCCCHCWAWPCCRKCCRRPMEKMEKRSTSLSNFYAVTGRKDPLSHSRLEETLETVQ